MPRRPRSAPTSRTRTVLAFAADLAQEEDARRAVTEAVAGLEALHTLVNVAGVRVYTPLADADAKDWQFISGVNILATSYCVKAALPALRASQAAACRAARQAVERQPAGPLGRAARGGPPHSLPRVGRLVVHHGTTLMVDPARSII